MRGLSVFVASGVVAAATPAAAHQFLDYFEYGRTELSPLGYRTAASVAEYARKSSPRTGGSYRILIVAHMDTAEAEAFSDELALRRAQSMATELVRLGLDPSRITLRSEGARQLARVTGPNVREPLNRRLSVDINL